MRVNLKMHNWTPESTLRTLIKAMRSSVYPKRQAMWMLDCMPCSAIWICGRSVMPASETVSAAITGRQMNCAQ